MSLSKQEESALLQVYDAYWHSYATGDIPTLASFLAEEYTQIGSVETEVFDNKNDAVHFIETTIDQIAGKVDMRNRIKKIELFEPFVLITEHTDLYVLTEGEWVFYARFRASSFLQKKEGQWKFIHQHSSMPDIRADEGENIATEKISRENIELRDAIKRRTIELEHKNQELAMEASLERVRTVAMGMHKSEDLKEVIKVVYDQFVQLKIEIEHTGFIVDYKEREDMHIWLADRHMVPSLITIPYFDSPHWNSFIDAKEKGNDFFANQLNFEEKNRFYQTLFEIIPDVSEETRKFYFGCPGLAISTILLDHIGLYIENFSGIPYTDEENAILMRFGKVFEQAYIRFNDLKQAEAQAREARIEAALERVRSRAMAMQKSSELSILIELVYRELGLLDMILQRGFIMIFDPSNYSFTWWMASNEEGSSQREYLIPYHENKPHLAYIKGWQEQNAKWEYTLQGTEKKEWDEFLFKETELVQLPPQIIANMTGTPCAYLHSSFSHFGCICAASVEPLMGDHFEIINRFSKVFDQCYTRFLDLQKAEEQAKEAQIELALERVRARSMSMFHSDEVLDVAAVMYDELKKLDFGFGACIIIIMDKVSGDMEHWVAGFDQKSYPESYHVPFFDHPYFKAQLEAWKNGNKYFVLEMSGNDKKSYDEIMFTRSGYQQFPEQEKKWMRSFEKVILSFAYMSQGALMWGPGAISEGDANILQRFAKVFDQAYTRFLDLQKSEAQAWEAKIEAALERVRAKAMAMHSSRDLQDTIIVFYHQLESFNITPKRCGVGLLNKENKSAEVLTMNTTEKGDRVEVIGKLNLTGHPVLDGIYQHWLLQEEYHPLLRGNEIKEYYELIQPQIAYPDYSSDIIQYGYFFYFPEGGVFIWTNKELSEDELIIHRRFTSVLSLAYRRYKDLQQAEALAKEATIEAALEKVRGKAMAMHNSNDLEITAGMVFTELRKLGISPMRCGVSIQNKENRHILYYSASVSEEGDNLSLVGSALLDDHPVLIRIYDHWILGEDYFPVLKGDELKSYYEKIQSHFSIPVNAQKDYVQYGYYLPFSEGLFYGWSEQPFTEEEIKILRRFNSIIDLTFRRYIELKKSEANALDAIRRASLDRVRAETASMRTTADLEKITPMIWNELSTLGVPFIRCGVFIMDEEQELIHSFLSTPDGKAIASFHLPYKASADLWETVMHWRKKENYQQHWDEAAFAEWTNKLIQQGFITSSDSYATEHRPTNLYLHFMPFTQGMLYVGNDTALNEKDLHLVQNLADAFSTAYARYEDFNRLEAAKEQVDKTLTDLKQAQSQLVQAEKMASLGELTAGIAHEIQNPLNFVNNFSEINMELSEEIVEAAKKGNLEEIIQLAEDIKSNQDKISEHGKRADAIVKGMLQHSRSSSGNKEPTDINKLADEYLRLAYHGLRAKEKSFNVTLKTDFDSSIGRINIISQDIGRVLLNLINNAFYAVNEKSKEAIKNYEPEVTVSTRMLIASENSLIRQSPPVGGRSTNSIIISVKDNGMGIPKKVLDKIFQPFFTTKPTGQGTGLGLSLSYDIVKAHGGELRVETKEGVGSEFIIYMEIVKGL